MVEGQAQETKFEESDEEFIKAVIECGVDVNTAEYRWGAEFGDDRTCNFDQEEFD